MRGGAGGEEGQVRGLYHYSHLMKQGRAISDELVWRGSRDSKGCLTRLRQ